MDWGIEIVLWLQSFRPTFDLLFRFFTFFGDEVFFLLLIPFVYWCLDRKTGVRLTILFLFSAYINAVAKATFSQSRPFQYDPRVNQLVEASGGGLPSGHTQASVIVWTFLAFQRKGYWAWILACLLMIFIPLSRMYLGVHFPTDLLGGYVLGAFLLIAYFLLGPKVEKWFVRQGLIWQVCLAIVVPGLLLLFFSGGEKNCITAGAALMGMSSGFALERRFVGFEAGGKLWKRMVCFFLGVGILFCLWAGLRIVFSGLDPELFFRFVRYATVGIWGSLGAPWVFKRLGLV